MSWGRGRYGGEREETEEGDGEECSHVVFFKNEYLLRNKIKLLLSVCWEEGGEGKIGERAREKRWSAVQKGNGI